MTEAQIKWEEKNDETATKAKVDFAKSFGEGVPPPGDPLGYYKDPSRGGQYVYKYTSNLKETERLTKRQKLETKQTTGVQKMQANENMDRTPVPKKKPLALQDDPHRDESMKDAKDKGAKESMKDAKDKGAKDSMKDAKDKGAKDNGADAKDKGAKDNGANDKGAKDKGAKKEKDDDDSGESPETGSTPHDPYGHDKDMERKFFGMSHGELLTESETILKDAQAHDTMLGFYHKLKGQVETMKETKKPKKKQLEELATSSMQTLKVLQIVTAQPQRSS